MTAAAQMTGEVVPATAPGRARVLIVDDSAVARSLFSRIIDESPGFALAAALGDARSALRFLQTDSADVIVLDLEMPGLSGLAALPDLLKAAPEARVLVVSSSCGEGAAATVQALALGAADTLVKPGPGFTGRFADVLLERLERLRERDAVPAAALARAPGGSSAAAIAEPAIVAIGASTGGIHALNALLRSIPHAFDAPILITQHLPATFTPFFAAQVAVLANRACDVARDHLRIVPGRAYIAPGDAHLRCVRTSDGAAIRLERTPAPTGCMPSVDPMLASVAEVFGGRALGVILSGMGRDGLAGARELRRLGGTLVAQDAASSVVWGMPGAVVGAGLAHHVLPPQEIGRMIAQSRGRR